MVHCAPKELSAGETVMLATETETERVPEPIRRRKKGKDTDIFSSRESKHLCQVSSII